MRIGNHTAKNARRSVQVPRFAGTMGNHSIGIESGGKPGIWWYAHQWALSTMVGAEFPSDSAIMHGTVGGIAVIPGDH